MSESLALPLLHGLRKPALAAPSLPLLSTSPAGRQRKGGLWRRADLAFSLASTLTGCVALGKQLLLPEPQSLHLRSGDNGITLHSCYETERNFCEAARRVPDPKEMTQSSGHLRGSGTGAQLEPMRRLPAPPLCSDVGRVARKVLWWPQLQARGPGRVPSPPTLPLKVKRTGLP